MTGSQLLRLCELAERLCPQVLLDLPLMTDADRLGVLAWLCSQALLAEAL